MDWQDNLKREIGGRIKRARLRSGLTQLDLATTMGVKRQSVAQWESGENATSAPQLARLAHLLHVSADWLCGQPTGGGGPTGDDLESLLTTALSIARQQRRSHGHTNQRRDESRMLAGGEGYNNPHNSSGLPLLAAAG